MAFTDWQAQGSPQWSDHLEVKRQQFKAGIALATGGLGCLRNYCAQDRHIVANRIFFDRYRGTIQRERPCSELNSTPSTCAFSKSCSRWAHDQCRIVRACRHSAPPCLRRVRKLEEAGVIESYHAVLNASKLGYDLVAFCMVGLKTPVGGHLKAFAAATDNWSIVRQAWMVNGDSDLCFIAWQRTNEVSGFRHRSAYGKRACGYRQDHADDRQVKKVGLLEVGA